MVLQRSLTMTLNPMLLFCLVVVIHNGIIQSNARQLKNLPDEKVVIGGGNKDEVDPASKNKMAKKQLNDDEQNPFPFPFPFPFPYPPQVPGIGSPITPVPGLPFPTSPPAFGIPGVPTWFPLPPFPPINIPGVPSFVVPSPPV